MSFTSIPSVGQLHENSCWAACLTWFLKASPGGRPSWTQKQVITEYTRSCMPDGSMYDGAMMNGWANDTRLKMNTLLFETPDPDLADLPLGSKPVCIAFKHVTGFAHMNVIWRADPGYVMCMEPYWPFPGTDGKRTGRMVRRAFEHFNYGDRVLLAWARPFDGATTSSPDDAS